MTKTFTKMMFFTTTLAALIISLASCTISFNSNSIEIKPLFSAKTIATGIDTTFTRSIKKDFTGIEASGFYKIVYTDAVDEVEVTCDKALVPYLIIKNQDDDLVFGTKSIALKDAEKISVLVPVSSKPLKSIDLSGACRFDTETILAGDKLEIETSGASRLDIGVEVRKLGLEMSGASKATFEGTAETFDVECSGACHIDAKELVTKKTEAEFSGACKGEFTADFLKAEASGATKISVNEDAEVDVNASGASKLERR